MIPISFEYQRSCPVKKSSKESAWLPEAAGFGQRLHSARIEVEDILSELQRLDEGVEVSPQRLQQVEERLSVLYGLQSRFSCQSVAELIALRDSLARELDGDSNLQERLEELYSVY